MRYLILRNLVYHWRGNLAVLLGVALGAAILTGALLVGDSLRGSLRALTLGRLGWVDEALLPGRFFRAALAQELPAERASAAILLNGTAATAEASGQAQRSARVTVLGVDPSFWPRDHVPGGAELWQSAAAGAVINRSLATELGIGPGAALTLQVHKPDGIPRETLLGGRKAEDVLEPLSVEVRVVSDDTGPAGFSLRATPGPVANVFVPLGLLQDKLDQQGRANAVLIGGARNDVNRAVEAHLTLDDWGLKVRTPADRAKALLRYLAGRRADADSLPRARWFGRIPDELARAAEANGNVLTLELARRFYETERPYFSLESRQLFIDPLTAAAARNAAISSPGRGALPGRVAYERPIFTYLLDTLADEQQHEVPYVVVAGVDMRKRLPAADGSEELRSELRSDEIALVQYPGSPLAAQPGDRVKLTYYVPDERNHLEKKTAAFNVRYLVPLTGSADDADLTPEFPGITDKLDMSSWENPPFPYEARRVKPVDEAYWKRYRATPRAYVSLDTAQRLWGNRFGQYTAIQVDPRDMPPRTLRAVAYNAVPALVLPAGPSPLSFLAALVGIQPETFARNMLAEMRPEQGGFILQPIRRQAEQASGGVHDFGVLFLGFSSFLIVSALLLVGLLLRLNLARRSSELGLLLAVGWTPGRVQRLLLAEGVVLAVLGCGVGLAGAAAYAPVMLHMLHANWPGGAGLAFLQLHARPASFAIGFAASFVVSLLTIYWSARALGRLTPTALLGGAVQPPLSAGRAASSWPWWLAAGSAALALALAAIGSVVTGHEARAGSFFGSGALLLTAGLTAVWGLLRRLGRQHTPQPTVTALGVRNAARHVSRSLLTAGLLAAAAFVIVAVESFHKETGADFLQRTGGSGGFALFGESDVPFFQDLDQPGVRADLGLDQLPTGVRFFPCRTRAGDDTSCLNLYQPLKPRVVAVPPDLIDRGGFSFAAHLATAEQPEQRENPWLLLNLLAEDGAMPCIVDKNTAQWVLHVPLGGIVEVQDDEGRPQRLRVVALLADSILQSEVLVSEANFLKLYPRREGFNFVLIDTGSRSGNQLRQVQELLQHRLAHLGLQVQTTRSRLEAYAAVENMYLATFQALGGLGLLLGAVGLALVLLRGVWERRSELGLLRAVGFRAGRIAWLVLAENLFLLLLGLGVGVSAALLAVAPHLAGAAAADLWLRIARLLAAVLSVGLCAGLAAVYAGLRTPILEALRRE